MLIGIAKDSTGRQRLDKRARRLRIILCRVTESSEVLPVAIALLSEHLHECIVTLMNMRPSMVERPGRCPAQYSAQRDRGAIGAAAAARLLQPLI